MDPIQTFLNELQKRIDAVSSQVIDFESEKNSILSIDNILWYDETSMIDHKNIEQFGAPLLHCALRWLFATQNCCNLC